MRGMRAGRPGTIVTLAGLVGAIVTLACLLGAGFPSAAAAAQPAYAPLNEPGPPLSVPLPQLQASLSCEPSVRNATVTPVLLNPATGVTPEQNYSWNYEPALTKLGIPWCTYTAPNDTLGNIATSGEYLVYAIRTMYAMAGRRIDIIGHSQGGMSMRWPLRFWPDTRAMVEDVIGFSGSNHGTTVVVPQECPSVGCPAADWQQIYQSPFIQALNSGAETFAGISYTEIWTHTDEVVEPNGSGATASAALHTGAGQITNVAIQQLCPADPDEHLLIGTIDPVAYALAADALTHPGPADVARTEAENPNLCSQLYMPGVNPADVSANIAFLQGAPGLGATAIGPAADAVAGTPVLHSQPALPCYVYATCTGANAAALVMSTRRRGELVVATVRAREGNALVPVPDVRVSVGRHVQETGVFGHAGFRLAPGRYRLSATRAGTDSTSRAVRVSRPARRRPRHR